MKAATTGKALRKFSSWLAARKLKLAAVLIIVFLVIPQSLESQIIPSPCCAIISAGLGSIASTITNVVGSALNAINTTMTSIDGFQRIVVWPQNLINRAKDVV